MKILALDSSATVASVALCEDGRLLAEYTIDNGNTHSETLLPMVEAMLASFKMTAHDIDIFAASSGPGSFTGVRIGMATLKGLAFGSKKPCVEISTLEALAENAVLHNGIICAVMNARRSQVYTATFRSDGKALTRLTEDEALSISELDERLSAYGEAVAFVGDGYDITLAALQLTEAHPLPPALRLQSAASVAAVAYRAYISGNTKTDREIKVNYLRPSQAERERLNKEKEDQT